MSTTNAAWAGLQIINTGTYPEQTAQQADASRERVAECLVCSHTLLCKQAVRRNS